MIVASQPGRAAFWCGLTFGIFRHGGYRYLGYDSVQHPMKVDRNKAWPHRSFCTIASFKTEILYELLCVGVEYIDYS